MIKKSVVLSIAVTFQQLMMDDNNQWTFEQQLVLQALRRSSPSLSDASEAQLGEYLRGLDPEQISGVASNVKGIFHELLVEHFENTDGDQVTAQIFESTNHPGADIEFFVDGTVIREIQLKAVSSPREILEHFEQYPEIDVLVTSEVYQKLHGQLGAQLESSGISNEELTKITNEALEELAGEGLEDVLQDGVVTSSIVGGALVAKAILTGKQFEPEEARATLELMGVGAGTALTIDALLNLV